MGAAHWLVRMDRRHRYAVAIVVLAVIVSIFLLSATGSKVCYDDACFIQYANHCAYASLTKKISTATVHFETGNCVLNKTVVSMDSYEPEEVREDFVGKSMICVFTRGDFSPLYLTTMVGLLDNCEGELKDTITYYQFY